MMTCDRCTLPLRDGDKVVDLRRGTQGDLADPIRFTAAYHEDCARGLDLGTGEAYAAGAFNPHWLDEPHTVDHKTEDDR
jgi:hypothetical protein